MKKLCIIGLILSMHFSMDAQIITIPDSNFKNALVNTLCVDSSNSLEPVPDSDVDTNNDGEIQLSEALAVQNLKVENQNIASLEGIQNFINLQHLNCRSNSLQSLDTSMLPGLWNFDCSNNLLTSLFINSVPNITVNYYLLHCQNNSLTTLDLHSNLYEVVDCSNNQIIDLDISNTSHIYEGYFYNNAMTSFIYPPGLQMGYLSLLNNPLTAFALPPAGFETLLIGGTNLTTLDLSALDYCYSLYIDNNLLLQSINLDNGHFEGEPGNTFIGIANNPLLQYVCIDDFEYVINEGGTLITVSEFQSITAAVPANVVVSTYCSFTPSGEYNTITGNITFDCGGSALNMSHVKVNINGAIDGFTFTNALGEYEVYSGINAITLTPELEIGGYFTITPPSTTYNFTNSGNNEIANFCISPNGIHPDLEVTLLATSVARPGFDANYQLIFKNKGTEVQSGTINLNFDDAILDFVTASPMTTSQVLNNLSWDFTNLSPFESRYILLTLNANGQTETPPLNVSDVLSYTASITAAAIDETPLDNFDELNQTVVGSVDPNDKTVSEGAQILPSQTDDYLHYMVRFQNTGTFAAENVVIKDRLSENLDPSTVEIIAASHPFRCTLTYGNKLEFFFEDINLPDATTNEPASHGYIAFKVKPADTVGLGSVIENTAGIYFDFDFPVMTNTVSTTVSLLAANSFDTSQLFTIYPNPVQDFINIKSVAKISSIEIHNNIGQVVYASVTAGSQIDVSGLASGLYLIRVSADGGNSIQKFIKL